jgi:hypothetical protein
LLLSMTLSHPGFLKGFVFLGPLLWVFSSCKTLPPGSQQFTIPCFFAKDWFFRTFYNGFRYLFGEFVNVFTNKAAVYFFSGQALEFFPVTSF